MKVLIIINFLFNLTIVGYLIYKFFPFYISVNRTFWCKKIYSFTLMKYTYKDKYSYSSSIGLFRLPIRNYRKMMEWDDKMFNTGEYKRYSK